MVCAFSLFYTTVKSKLLLLFFFVASASPIIANENANLVIWSNDGTKMVYELSEEPKVFFTSEQLIIKAHEMEASYNLSEISRITYENAVTDISSAVFNEPLRFDGKTLLITSSSEKTDVCIYTLNGRLVQKYSMNASDTYTISLSSYNAGIYIVRVNELIYRILKK